MAGAGGLGWPDPAVLGGWNALQEARAWVGVPDNVWEVLLRQTGMYDAAVGLGVQTARIRDFAAIPPVPFVKCVHDDVSVTTMCEHSENVRVSHHTPKCQRPLRQRRIEPTRER